MVSHLCHRTEAQALLFVGTGHTYHGLAMGAPVPFSHRCFLAGTQHGHRVRICPGKIVQSQGWVLGVPIPGAGLLGPCVHPGLGPWGGTVTQVPAVHPVPAISSGPRVLSGTGMDSSGYLWSMSAPHTVPLILCWGRPWGASDIRVCAPILPSLLVRGARDWVLSL